MRYGVCYTAQLNKQLLHLTFTDDTLGAYPPMRKVHSIKAVLAYLEGTESIKSISNRFKVSLTPLKNWVAHYRENGVVE